MSFDFFNRLISSGPGPAGGRPEVAGCMAGEMGGCTHMH